MQAARLPDRPGEPALRRDPGRALLRRGCRHRGAGRHGRLFRRTEDVLPIADEAVAIGAHCLWQQIGVINEEADAAARAAGLDSVMDRCVKIEHAPALRRPELGRRQHRRDLGAPAAPDARRMTHAMSRPRLSARDARHPRRADPGRGDRRARAADPPDHQLRLRQRRSRGQPVQPADLRQRLLAASQSHGGGAGRAGGRARRRARRAGRASGMAAEALALHDAPAGRATTSSRRARSTAARSAAGRQPEEARHRDHLRRRRRRRRLLPRRCGRTRARCSPRPWATRA